MENPLDHMHTTFSKMEEFSIEGRAAIEVIKRCMQEAQRAFGTLSAVESQYCLDFHIEGSSLNHCVRWGLAAAEEIHEKIAMRKIITHTLGVSPVLLASELEMSPRDFKDFTYSFLVAALWANEEQNEGLQGKTIFDFGRETVLAVNAECAKFLNANASDLALAFEAGEADYSFEQAGHDMWMDCNKLGVGFFDRGLGEAGKRLSEACRKWGEIGDPGVADDGTLCIDGLDQRYREEVAQLSGIAAPVKSQNEDVSPDKVKSGTVLDSPTP